MRRLINILILGFLLSIIEFIILLILTQCFYVFRYSVPYNKYSHALNVAIEISIVRFLFYFVFWVLSYYITLSKVKLKYPILKLALFNGFLYLVISILLMFLFPFASEYFRAKFFYFSLISTLLSPVILNTFPYLKRVIRTSYQ